MINNYYVRYSGLHKYYLVMQRGMVHYTTASRMTAKNLTLKLNDVTWK